MDVFFCFFSITGHFKADAQYILKNFLAIEKFRHLEIIILVDFKIKLQLMSTLRREIL